MKVLNVNSIDKDLINILEEAQNLKFSEIIMEEEKGIYFNKYEKGKLIVLPYKKNLKINRNLLLKYLKSLTHSTNAVDRFSETFLLNYKQNTLFFRLYLFFNKETEITLSFKLLINKENYILENYFKYIEDKEYKNNKEKIKSLFNQILTSKEGLYIISSNSFYIKKNFYYSMIQKLIKLDKKLKILLYERIHEKIWTNEELNNNFLFQFSIKNNENKLIENMEKDINFINPDILFLETEILNKDILLKILEFLYQKRKIFIFSNIIDINIMKNYIEKILIENNFSFEYFLEYFKNILILENNNNKNVIKKIVDKDFFEI